MEDKVLFYKLNPKNDVDLSGYEDAFNFIFENKDVRNIAISGAYSSGKSSILESYKVKDKKHKYLHISLTHFQTLDEQVTDTTTSEAILEGKILNQLLHKIPMNQIPQTGFKIKQKSASKMLIPLAIFVCTFVLSIAFLIFSPSIFSFAEELDNAFIKKIMTTLFSPYARIIDGLLCAACAIFSIFKIVTGQKLRNMLRKISFQGNEIEILENQDDSCFDKYLNEVLYLFENVKEDVIVFEDIDRFDEAKIFERLHEINNIININRQKTLRFFYLIRDDIFTSKDRTKFFDYIIPVVPVIDSSNSYEKLVEFLNNSPVHFNIDNSFLQKLSLYIDDMRLLKNIFNEFTIYIKKLDTTELNHNKMLALITYKNLFPRDFNDLQLARGFVHELFEHKLNLIQKAVDDYNQKQQKIVKRIEWAKKEILVSKEELEDAYNAKEERLPKSGYYRELTAEGTRLKQQYEAEKPCRLQAIQDNQNDKVPDLKKELAEVEHSILLIQSRSLSGLITRENIDEVFSTISHTNELGEKNNFEKIKRSEYFDLLKFLIRNGYIDETYSDYMSYFYPGSISANDKMFLRRITDRRGSNYSYALKDPDAIIRSPILTIADFEQEEVLNFNLFEYLLMHNNTEKISKYLQMFIKQIKENSKFDFISEYYNGDNTNGQFTRTVNKQWPLFFSTVLNNNILSANQIKRFSIETLYHSDLSNIEEVNVNNCLTEYISESPDYLNISQPNISKLVDGFKSIGVSFREINYEVSYKQLFEAVYTNNLYEINFVNIKLILKIKYNIESEYNLTHKNYSLVFSQTESPLCVYLSDNILQYVEVVLTNCEGMICDDELFVIDILNHNIISNSLKARYIESLSTKVSNIVSIKDDKLWKLLLERDVVSYSTENCLIYFNRIGLDESLVEYINAIPNDICFTNLSNKFNNDELNAFSNAIVICNEISTEKYKSILKDLEYVFNAYDSNTIDKEKIEVLVESSIMHMDLDSMDFIRANYSEIKFSFIKRNLNDYICLQNESVIPEEILTIIDWNISDEQKLSLLKFTDEPVSVIGKDYSDEVKSYIIENNFDPSDFSFLIKDFTNNGEKTQKAIYALTVSSDSIRSIISRKLTIDEALFSLLLKDENVQIAQKLELLDNSLATSNEEKYMQHLDELELGELKNIFLKSNSRRRYDKNEITTTVLESLKSHGWIDDFYEDEKNSQKYVVKKGKGQ